MTDPINPGTTPESTPPASAWPPPADPALPPIESAEPGAAAPAQAVQRDSGDAVTGRARRSTRLRWAVVLIGVAIVLVATAAVFALTAGRPSISVAVGYMPDNAVQYGEYRLDLPGDQRQKLAEFLSVFPGFKDQSTFDSKLDETFDKIVAAVSSNQQTYTADIKPWFGGVIAFGSGPIETPAPSAASSPAFAGQPLIAVSIKDKAKAADWIAGLGEQLTRGEYNGAILFSGAARDSGTATAIAVNDEVILVGTDASVKKAVDSHGDGKLADDEQFKAAFRLATDDYVAFTFMDYQAYVSSYLDMVNNLGGRVLDSTAVDDELASLVPAWFGSVSRFENDALVSSSAFPSIDIGFDGNNRKSTLLGWAPPSTIAYSEVHDAGAAFTALLDRLKKQPDAAKAIQQVDATTGIGLEGIFGWWGDAALVASEDASGHLGGGLVIIPADAAKAKTAANSLRGLLALGGGQAGIKVTDVQHGDATITVVDFSGAMGGAASLPAGYKPELAFTFTDQVVVVGYGQAFVESVLDAGPGPSLADDARVSSLVKRVGEENLGFTFVDVRRVRELFETIAKAGMTREKWSEYVKEYQPFLLPFDAMASSIRKDGDLNRLPGVVTVTQP
jgi:Protein of unknown function (DUF3352)